MLCRRRYYAVGHHKAGLRPLCTDLYGPPAPQTAHHSNIVSCSRSHCAPGAFLHFGTPLPRCRGPPFSRFASPPNLEKRRTENVVFCKTNVTPGMRFCKRGIRRICSRGSRKPIMVSVKCILYQGATMRSFLQSYLNELKSYGKNAV